MKSQGYTGVGAEETETVSKRGIARGTVSEEHLQVVVKVDLKVLRVK
jgi:hypothetical protein